MVKLVILQKQSIIDVSEAALGRIPVWRGRGACCLGKYPVFGRGGDGFCVIISDEPTPTEPEGLLSRLTSRALTYRCTISGRVGHSSTRQCNNYERSAKRRASSP